MATGAGGFVLGEIARTEALRGRAAGAGFFVATEALTATGGLAEEVLTTAGLGAATGFFTTGAGAGLAAGGDVTFAEGLIGNNAEGDFAGAAGAGLGLKDCMGCKPGPDDCGAAHSGAADRLNKSTK